MDTALFFIFILVITCLTILVVLLFSAYSKQTLVVTKLKKQNEDLEEKLPQKTEQLLEHAHEQSLKIIEDSQRKADEILSETKSFRKETEELLKTQLGKLAASETNEAQDLSNQYLEHYKLVLEAVQNNNIKVVQKILEDIKTEGQHSVEDFKQIIEKETVSSQKIVEEKIEQEYEILRQELETYRKNRLKKIDESIYEILQNVSKYVFGKTINLADQENLVLEALKQAKEEGIFQ